MERIGDVFKRVIPERKPLEPDEYIDEKDGLVHCKKCGTPRECKFGDNPVRIFPILCKCKQEERDRQQAEEERKERLQRIEAARLEAITIPSYRGYRFGADDSKTPNTTQICKNYVKHFSEFAKTGQGLLLYGDVGTGKTFLALCIANALIDREIEVLHTSLAAIVAMAQDFNNADYNFNKLMRKRLIVIDDLGTERATSFAEEQIYKFIDGCNTHNVALIITTNYTPKELEAAAADTSDLTHARIYSRLLEKCYPVKVNDLKRREANTQRNKAATAELLGIKKKI